MYAGRLYNHIDSFVMVIRRGGRTTKQNAIDGMYMLLLFEFDYSPPDSSGFNEADVVVLDLQH